MARKAPWKKLAADLAELGVESEYLSRVRARVDPEQELKALEEEIAGEIAQALGRTEERLNLALPSSTCTRRASSRPAVSGLRASSCRRSPRPSTRSVRWPTSACATS